MKSVIFSVITFLSMLSLAQKGRPEYFGVEHNEANFTITSYIRFEQAKAPTKDDITPSVNSQMRYMLGLMRSREIKASALYPKWSFTTLAVTKESAGVWLIKYNLSSKGLFAKGTTEYTFTVPYNVKRIYAQSQGLCQEAKSGVAESNFWYHWEPLISGCPLIENRHYFNTTVALSPIPNTTQTYPEYEKLLDSTKTIKISMFYGLAEHGFPEWHPDSATFDWGIESFKNKRKELRTQGFSERVLNSDEILQLYPFKGDKQPYIIELTKAGPFANIRVRMVLADTDLNGNSKAFHTLFRQAVATDSVILYNGHSGIGKNLSIASIEAARGAKLVFNPNYQIYLFGSCVPYAYYTDMYFNRKKTAADPNGTKLLDIFTFGQESLFDNQADSGITSAIVRYAQSGQKESYQDIIIKHGNYYFGINGDEDNPTSP